jgi:hypothetical protein
MKLPDDVFRQELLPFLTVHDIVNLDNACLNHKYRTQLLDKISGVILRGDEYKSMEASLFKWLGMRRIYLINMVIDASDYNLIISCIVKDYDDQFRYTQHLILIGDDFYDPQVKDRTLLSIVEHCTGLQSLSLSYLRELTDNGFINIYLHCSNLKSLKVDNCVQITDASFILISAHCTGLQFLHLNDCDEITDASICSLYWSTIPIFKEMSSIN